MPRAHNISQQNGEPSTQLDGGSVVSAWLSEDLGDGGKLEWQTARSARAHPGVKLYPSGPAILVSEGSGEPPGASSRADDGAFHIQEGLYKPTRFLDRHHFDAHVPHASLVEGLVSLHGRVPQRNSYPGTTLAITAAHLTRRATRSASTSLLAQCGGRAGKELVVSPFASAERPRPGLPAALAKTEVTHNMKMKLPAAILDIQSMPRSGGAAFAVRTHAAISLLQIERPVADKAQSESTEPAYLAPVTFGSEHLGGHAPADCALSPLASSKRAKQALIVDETGGLWEVGTTAETARIARGAWTSPYAGIDQLRQGAPPGERTPFARVTYGMTDRQAVVALEDAVRYFDLQDPANDRTVFRVHHPKTRILDLCKPSHDAGGTPIRVVVTSDEVTWLDISNAALGSEPVLRYRHRRRNDNTLSISTVFAGGVHHAFLWSRQVSHITVLCYTETLPVQLLCEPYVLQAARPDFQRTGLALLGQPASNHLGPGRQALVTMLEQSSAGEVYQHELVPSSAEPAVVQMAEVTEGRPAMGPSSGYEQPAAVELRKHRVGDFRKIYRGIFSSEPSLSDRLTFPSALRVEDLPTNEDAHQCLPLELAVTLRSSEEEDVRPPGVQSFSSVQALDRASLALGQLEAQYANLQLHRQVTYEHTFTDARMGVNLAQAPPHAARALQGIYTLSQRPGESPEGQKLREAQDFACEQLSVDLALSRQVLSAHPVQAPYPGEVDEAMMRFNSIADIPSVDFGYFNPVLKRPQPGQTGLDTPAARALLSEWKLGADPEVRPAYNNPYDGRQQQERVANKQYAAYRSRVAEGQPISASQPAYQPPRDITKEKQRDIAGGKEAPAQKRAVQYEGHKSHDGLRSVDEEREEEPVLNTGQAAQPGRNGRSEPQTQGQASVESQTQSQSQSQTQTRPAMPYSQVVPGAFGGRPVKRKRMGGF